MSEEQKCTTEWIVFHNEVQDETNGTTEISASIVSGPNSTTSARWSPDFPYAKQFEDAKLLALAPFLKRDNDSLKAENERLRKALDDAEAINYERVTIIKSRIARAFYGMENKMELQENPFDGMNYENLFGMKVAYADVLVALSHTEAPKTK